MRHRVTLADIEAAAVRIRRRVRATPMIRPNPVREPFCAGDADLFLKLECLQVTGSFKPRGASNKVALLPQQEIAGGICTASGGNHGLAVAYVSWANQVPATVFVPTSTSRNKVKKIEAWGAAVTVAGDTWDQSNDAALAHAARAGNAYVHPFSDPAVIAGQGTLGLEILADMPAVDTVLVAIGGGGLIAGVATAMRALRPDVKVIGVEPTGAPTLHDSLAAGGLVTLERIATAAGTLAPQRSSRINLDIIGREVAEIVLVSDDDMRAAAQRLWFELGVATELSGAATLAALMSGVYRPRQGERVVALICGAGTDGLA